MYNKHATSIIQHLRVPKHPKHAGSKLLEEQVYVEGAIFGRVVLVQRRDGRKRFATCALKILTLATTIVITTEIITTIPIIDVFIRQHLLNMLTMRTFSHPVL